MSVGLSFMQDIDQRFRDASGFTHARHYSIFYSRFQRSPLLILGINPGGDPTDLGYPKTHPFHENWHHEYVDEHYTIANVMRPALVAALGAKSAEDLRGIPKANVVFNRSKNTDVITGGDLSRMAALSAPFLAEIVTFVQPVTILFEGHKARKLAMHHLFSSVEEDTEATIFGPYRGRECRYFTKHQAVLKADGRVVTLLSTGHPSSFGYLPRWPSVVEALKLNLGVCHLPRWGF